MNANASTSAASVTAPIPTVTDANLYTTAVELYLYELCKKYCNDETKREVHAELSGLWVVANKAKEAVRAGK